MHSERFRSLLTAHGPYGSVFFDDSHDTEDARTQTELKWRGLREELERQGAAPELTSKLESAVLDAHPSAGRGGRAVVASSEGVLVDEPLLPPPGPPVVRFSTLPYLVPFVEYGVEHPPYLVVAVDHTGADIAVHRDGGATTIAVEGGGYPVHKAGGAETSGYGDPQPRAEEAASRNIHAVADRVTTIADESSPELVFVVGEVRSRADLAAALPARVCDRVVQLQVGARHSGFDQHDLKRAIADEFERRRSAAIDAAAQRFQAERGRHSGLATEGLPGVCAALREGAVETLIVGDVGDRTVVADDDLTTTAPNADVLSELGAAPTRVLRADEALPMAAISIGADLLPAAPGVSLSDGVAAVLRYPPRRPAGTT